MNRKKIDWRDQAKAQLRAIDQTTALRILHALAAYAATGEGDVKRLPTKDQRAVIRLINSLAGTSHAQAEAS